MSEAKETSEQALPKKGKGRLIFLIAILGIFIGGGSLGVYKFVIAKDQDQNSDHDSKKKDAPVEAEAPAKIVSLKPIVVNLRDTKGTRYLKVSIGLETRSEKVVEALNAKMVPLNDFLIDRLSNMRIEEIDNTAGRNKLKRELLYGTNDLLADTHAGSVEKLYFSEFVIQ